MLNNDRSAVAVIGLGKLGLPWACVLASKGYSVRGIDCDSAVIDRIERNCLGAIEPELHRLVIQSRSKLSIGSRFEVIREADIAFVIVPTPSEKDHRFSLQYVLPAVRSVVREAVAQDLDPFTIVVVSTVMPGDCRERIWPAIVEESGPRRGAGFSLAYCPEFVALGNVVQGMRRPELVLIGSDSPETRAYLADFYRQIVDSCPRFHLTSLLNAEIAKLALNGMLAVKITYANLLAQLCHRLDGANVDVVTSVLGSDSRIGGKYLRGGMGFGGPCLPRDVRALATLCHEHGANSIVPESISAANDSIPGELARWVLGVQPRDAPVGIVGLAYTAGTDVVEGSQAIDLVEELVAREVPVCVYDPNVAPFRRAGLWERVGWAESMPQLLSRVRKVVLTRRDTAIYDCDPRLLQDHIVFDCWRGTPTWRQLAMTGAVQGLEYFALGAVAASESRSYAREV